MGPAIADTSSPGLSPSSSAPPPPQNLRGGGSALRGVGWGWASPPLPKPSICFHGNAGCAGSRPLAADDVTAGRGTPLIIYIYISIYFWRGRGEPTPKNGWGRGEAPPPAAPPLPARGAPPAPPGTAPGAAAVGGGGDALGGVAGESEFFILGGGHTGHTHNSGRGAGGGRKSRVHLAWVLKGAAPAGGNGPAAGVGGRRVFWESRAW